ncbi:cytochrome P450 89A2-like [Panicum miliaceum]|uniref:Cytochrome P450 89A2-like n=1 Tax=Panicum miliaceum TaxID=4540 RepID=A0A3L6Q0U5_PANMI|nr:cytochrome P450 89A2-like [Panicum miliaceum]
MEVVQLLAVGLAVLVFLAARRRRSRHAHTTRPMPTVEVGDPDVARRLIVGQADSFSNHPNPPLAVDLDTGHPKTESVTSAPCGPYWRALRSNLTANVLHPSRLGRLVVPVQRGAAEALVADLRSATRRGAGGVVVAVRDGVYAAQGRLMALKGPGEPDTLAPLNQLFLVPDDN